jgi:hypothetical protein
MCSRRWAIFVCFDRLFPTLAMAEAPLDSIG